MGVGGFYAGLLWADDSRTLYFTLGDRLWSATLASDDNVEFELQDTGFDLPGQLWDRHPDGRFLVVTFGAPAAAPEQATAPRLVVISNWIAAIEARLGSGN